MLKKICCAAFLAIGVSMYVGCDSKDDTTPSTPDAPKASAEGAGSAASATGGAVKDAASSASEKAGEMTAAAKEKAGEMKDQASAAANNAMEEGKKKLDEVMTYIKDNKLDLAEKSLDGLEKIKSSLPEAIQSKLGEARTMLNAAKAKAGAGLPG